MFIHRNDFNPTDMFNSATYSFSNLSMFFWSVHISIVCVACVCIGCLIQIYIIRCLSVSLVYGALSWSAQTIITCDVFIISNFTQTSIPTPIPISFSTDLFIADSARRYSFFALSVSLLGRHPIHVYVVVGCLLFICRITQIETRREKNI